MKKTFVLVVSIFILLLVLSCSSEKNLLEISYDSQNTSNMTLESGEKYIYLGVSPFGLVKEKKVAFVRDSEKDAYAYSVKGYDSKDVLIVEIRLFMENTSAVYIRSDMENIPGDLVEIGPSPEMGDIIFNDKTYYHFRVADSSFKLGDKLGQTTTLIYHDIDSNNVYTPLDQPKEVIAHLYSIPGLADANWIAVQKEHYSGEFEIYATSIVDFIPKSFIELNTN